MNKIEKFYDCIYWKLPYIFGYNARYILIHPNIFFGELWLRIKWAWQRVFRGYDDRVIWSVDYYLSSMIPKWMNELKNNDDGVPSSLFVGLEKDESGNPTDESIEIARVKWNEILTDIGKGFAAYNEMNMYLCDDEKIDELKIIFNHGFDLFKKYFSDLWC